MADLDVEIDVPDDDGLDPPVRVLGGSLLPPWFKALGVLILGAMAAIVVTGYLLGRARGSDDPAAATEEVTEVTPTSEGTPIDSAEASPAIERSLQAIDGWESFARTGDLSAIEPFFDPNGPQYALFAEQAASNEPAELELTARELTEASGDGMVTVSMELVVSGPDGESIYPYNLVYLDGNQLIWTVVDRRAPGTVALPPAQATIDLARQNWSTFAGAVAAGDGAAAGAVVTERTLELAASVAEAVASGDRADPLPLSDPALFDLLVERASAAGADDANDALLSLLDDQQRQAIASGDLAVWTQIDPERVIASLEVGGQAVATVPFSTSTGGWVFDLAGALETSQ